MPIATPDHYVALDRAKEGGFAEAPSQAVR
ncbi:MAG: hypothetical protein JWR34_3579 [Mycobacterium sp.]|nr:hypothetical protein [Mycobacterium sp.]